MLSTRHFRTYTDIDIADIARDAAILEASLSPKPGLVSPETSGAHHDMDYHTFIRSALALHHYFKMSAQIGEEHYNLPAHERFHILRLQGIEAEKQMLQATQGVNTHKGLIFSMGLICCSTGQLLATCEQNTHNATQQSIDYVQTICQEASLLVHEITEKELQKTTNITQRPLTAGERIYIEHGFSGIRGEAQAGFPHVVQAFRFFQTELTQIGFHQASCKTLLYLIANTNDTNIVHRTGITGLRNIQQQAQQLLTASTPYLDHEKYLQFCHDSTQNNLSPGGCADLLALVFFFHQLLPQNH